MSNAEAFQIISFSRSHSSQAYQLFCQMRDTPWSQESFLSSVETGVCFIAKDDEMVVGLIICSYCFEQADLLDVCVSPEYRRRGIAAALIETAFAELIQKGVQSLLLEVADNNLGAKTLYSTLGFAHIDTRKNYYTKANGEADDALIMQKILGSN
ncbi:ribosomal protein S18-alanine N-acetyltransferase [Glaciecola sp. 1036]|uniref:ribosomal protein S18-alanine N-acetyltransferase n=1 Tax=Alteromonadaceae TaxID=72275 RepID=UPI003CFF9D73